MNDYPDDFNDMPHGVGELRATKSQQMSDWSVREMLVNLLRDIDSGHCKATTAFVALGQILDTRETITGYRACGPNRYVIFGVVEQAVDIYKEAN